MAPPTTARRRLRPVKKAAEPVLPPLPYLPRALTDACLLCMLRGGGANAARAVRLVDRGARNLATASSRRLRAPLSEAPHALGFALHATPALRDLSITDIQETAPHAASLEVAAAAVAGGALPHLTALRLGFGAHRRCFSPDQPEAPNAAAQLAHAAAAMVSAAPSLRLLELSTEWFKWPISTMGASLEAAEGLRELRTLRVRGCAASSGAAGAIEAALACGAWPRLQVRG